MSQVVGVAGDVIGARADPAGGALNSLHGLAQGAGGGVEIDLQRLEFGSQNAVDTRRQITGSQARERRADGLHGLGLSLFGGFAFGFQRRALFILNGQIAGDSQFHVQEDRLVQRDEAIGQFAVGLGVAEQAFGALGDHRADQLFSDDGVAANIPARLQLGPHMGPSDALDIAQVVGAIVGGDDASPVSGLGALGCGDMSIVAEFSPGLGKGADLAVEAAERAGDLGLDDRLQGSQRDAVALVKPHEGHALIQLGVRAHAIDSDS